MEQMEFGGTWRQRIKGCISTARVSILVTGSPAEEFSMERGIRQGDPLTPFLLIIAAEATNIMILEDVEQRLL